MRVYVDHRSAFVSKGSLINTLLQISASADVIGECSTVVLGKMKRGIQFDFIK